MSIIESIQEHPAKQVSSEKFSIINLISDLSTIIYIEIMIQLIFLFIVGLCFINLYLSNSSKIGPLFLICSLYHQIKLILYVLFYKYSKPLYAVLRNLFYYTLGHSISYAVIYYGLYLYSENKISKNDLWIFVLPQIFIVCAMMFFKPSAERFSIFPIVRLKIVPFLETLQNIFIALNIAIIKVDWDLALIYYEIYYLLIFYVVTVLAVVAFMLLVYWVYVHKFAAFYFIVGIFISAIYFYICWIGFLSYFIFDGFVNLMRSGQLSSSNRGATINPSLYNCGIYLVFYSAGTLLWLTVGIVLIRLNKTKFYTMEKSIGHRLQWVLDLMSFNLTIVSKPESSMAINYETQQEEENMPLVMDKVLEICFICRVESTDVILKPCGHSGMCSRCLRLRFKVSEKCPICNANVKRYYTIRYNPEEKIYEATGVYKLNNQIQK